MNGIKLAKDLIELHELRVRLQYKMLLKDVLDIIYTAVPRMLLVQPGLTGIDFGMGQWNFTGTLLTARYHDDVNEFNLDIVPLRKIDLDKEEFPSNEALDVVIVFLNYLQKEKTLSSNRIIFNRGDYEH